jgi:DNA-binding LacI/PurR family transcriptional regulator
VRVDLVVAYLSRLGIQVTAEVGDEDPFTAATDALASWPADELIVSTLPQTRSGWLRRDLVDRIRDAVGRPVQHVVTDPAEEGLAVGVTLVVANRTAGGNELMELLRKDAEQEDRIFIVVMPLEGKDGESTQIARDRLQAFVGQLRENGIVASGMIGDPDPYDATLNALDQFTIDHVVISTLPGEKSGWLRADIVDRVRNATQARVDHVEVELEAAPV